MTQIIHYFESTYHIEALSPWAREGRVDVTWFFKGTKTELANRLVTYFGNGTSSPSRIRNESGDGAGLYGEEIFEDDAIYVCVDRVGIVGKFNEDGAFIPFEKPIKPPDPFAEKEKTHPSYGLMSISRGTCSQAVSLFGSSLPHSTTITLEIHKASLQRNLGSDSVFEKGIPLISVDMSVTQFADAMTTLNSHGTPVTIKIFNGSRMPACPFESKRQQFNEEFADHMEEIASDTNRHFASIQKILAKDNIGKNDRAEIIKQFEQIKAQIADSIPFMAKQWTEQLDRSVLEAKNEIDAHLESRIKQYGLEDFKKQCRSQILPELPQGTQQ